MATTETAETDSNGSTGRAAAPASNGPTIAVTDLSRTFGDAGVLDGVSLSITPGKIVAFVGPNGSGKSTLLWFLARVHTPNEGIVMVGSAESGGGWTRMDYLPQQPSFRAGFSAANTLDFYVQFMDEGIDVTDALECVGLVDAVDRRMGMLFGGMTRLPGLGQAPVGDPAVVVLGKSAGNLGPGIVERLFDIVSDLADAGVAVVLSSCNLGSVERTADRMVVLDDGRFVVDGDPWAVVGSIGAADLQTAFGDLVATGEVARR